MREDPDRSQLFESLLNRVRKIVEGSSSKEEKLKTICHLLRERVSHYDWVGFYLVDEAAGRNLILGPFVGEATEHVCIPFGRGICGQAAERRETIVVQDVSEEENYLSCSPKVRSEIVVPIFAGSRLVGELDIDSHTLSPFTEEDRRFLEAVCKLVGGLF